MAKQKLTNIRPREVALVDQGANLEDFYVTKKQDGEKMGKKTDKVVLKKMEVAIHKVNFFKSQFATKEECIEKMQAEGIVGAENLEMDETDWEFQFTVNPATSFEGTSLGMYNYVTLNQGVDSLVGVMKSLDGVVEKAGAKMSKTRLKKLNDIVSNLTELSKELGDEPDDDGEPVTKSNKDQIKESEMGKVDTKVKKNEEKPVETTPVETTEEKPVETTEEKPAEEKPAETTEEKPVETTEEKPAEESEVEKRLAKIEKKQETEVKELKTENAELKKRLADLEDAPAEGNGSDDDTTEQPVEKNQKSMWSGVL